MASRAATARPPTGLQRDLAGDDALRADVAVSRAGARLLRRLAALADRPRALDLVHELQLPARRLAGVGEVGLVRQLRRGLPGPARPDGLWHAAIFTAIFLPGMIFLPMVTAVLVDRVANRKLARDLPPDPAGPGDDPGPAHLHPLGVDVLERDRPDQLRPRRRPRRLRSREPADLARLDEHRPSSRSR